MTRPDLLVLAAGTGTGVGKTWTCIELTRAFQMRKMSVAIRKPVQSFEPGALETDADKLAAVTGDNPESVCLPHRWYAKAMAPPMAASSLGLASYDIHELATELRWDERVDVGLVEMCGGICSPLAADGDTIDYALLSKPDVALLVADSSLDTVNDVRLGCDALHPFNAVTFLNRFDESNELHRRNRDWLIENDGITVTTSILTTVDALLEQAVISLD